MKALKVISTILLTIIFVVLCFAAEIITIVNLTVTNPWFYKTALQKVGLYENVYDSVIGQLKANVISQDEAIAEMYREDVYLIIDEALPKEQFEKEIGLLVGNTVDFVLYGNDEGEMPVKMWIANLETAIANSELQTKIDDLDHVLDITLTSYIRTFDYTTDENNKISDVIYKFMAPTDTIKENIDYIFYSIRYWISWLKISLYIALASIVVIMGLLFIIWHKKVSVVFRINGTFLIVNSIIVILTGGVLFMSVTIVDLLGKIPAMFESYIDIAQNVVNPIATFVLIIGIILLGFAILSLIMARVVDKKKDLKEEKELKTETELKEVTEQV